MRRLASSLMRPVGVVLVAAASLAALGAVVAVPASAEDRCVEVGCVRAVQVTGLIDPIIIDFVSRTVKEANSTPGTVGVVLQLDSEGVAVDDAVFTRFVDGLVSSAVPVTAWVGTDSQALGGSAEMVMVLPDSSMSPGSSLGDIGEQRLPGVPYGDLLTGRRSVLRSQTVGAERAKKIGAVSRVTLSAGDHLVGLPDVNSKQVTDAEGRPKLEPVTIALVGKLDLWPQLLHTVASPAVGYLMLAIGIGLLIFEFFTAGIGVAGMVGAAALALAGYGLGVLPARPWAVVVLLVAGIAFAIDVQAGVARFWTAVGAIFWGVGSVWLFDGVSLPWLALAVGVGGMLLAMISGMPAMVRSRFGTPTIGREWMLGTEGDAVTTIDPDGTIRIDGALWRARTNRATPIAAGDRVRVALIDGLTIEVEPLEGQAVDYREKRSKVGDSAENRADVESG